VLKLDMAAEEANKLQVRFTSFINGGFLLLYTHGL
jgi:hypothetical protein